MNIKSWPSSNPVPFMESTVVVCDNSFFKGVVLSTYKRDDVFYVVLEKPDGSHDVERADVCLPHVQELEDEAQRLYEFINTDSKGDKPKPWTSLIHGGKSQYYKMIVEGIRVEEPRWVYLSEQEPSPV